MLKWWEENLEGVFLTAMLIIFSVLVMVQVIMRYLVGSPLVWSEELCRVLLSYSGFMSIGYCARKDLAIKLDVILNLVPPIIRRILLNFTTLLMIALLSYLLNGCWDLIIDTKLGLSVLPGMNIPLYWLYVGSFAGLALGLIRYVQCLFRTHFYRAVTQKVEG